MALSHPYQNPYPVSDTGTGTPYSPQIVHPESNTEYFHPEDLGAGGNQYFYDEYYGDYIAAYNGRIYNKSGSDVTDAVYAARRRALANNPQQFTSPASPDNVVRNDSAGNAQTVSVNNSLGIDMNEGLIALGQYLSNAEQAGTNSTNALNMYMWEEGEKNTDRRLAEERAFTAAEARYAMDRQEYWSNTAHQREVADLKAAGLNPVLSANGQGASTPSGLMGGSSAVGANGFSAQKPNIVAAYNAAGEFVSSMLALRENMRQFDKQFSKGVASDIFSSIFRFLGLVAK